MISGSDTVHTRWAWNIFYQKVKKYTTMGICDKDTRARQNGSYGLNLR